jgi:hypothetical protein
MASGYQKADFDEMSAIWEVLRTVASSEMVNGVKTCIYQEGWSDERVLEASKGKLRPRVGVGSVKNLRLDKMGTIRPPAAKRPEPQPKPEPEEITLLWEAVKALKARVDKTHTIEAVNKWAQTIKDAYDKIEQHVKNAEARLQSLEETQKQLDEKLAKALGVLDSMKQNPP